ncbi:indole-3-glycerol phosphate synthase TrpC [Hymenobacter sp. BT186]|uniref:Indole-3-glycerol phosphate synthase n=1 Tax=Hymenobacter telluris TaxID=2816474 RepID=A0A939JAR8_9BACT|nr:indole-3-glycerol phosphate synthase TrpC [Hymenobacter telluris]MBO0356530.1 indole-3-glycerol phosphate synthase TrpC [Hymenobacter telluris]MBW3372555.1 indole-3-glycerol phosphate synthase TrpC [Hymenobacter norwichensis]
MPTILDKIITHKRQEVLDRQALVPVKLLEKSLYMDAQPLSLRQYLLRDDLSGIIAEFKRKSPSKGVINAHAPVERTTLGYMQAGASALSVLTDSEFFGGKNEDLTVARRYNFCPILRKDFVVDEYQILEAKSIGADAVLLIAAVLTGEEVLRLGRFAKSLGLEVLLEIHNAEELDKTLHPDAVSLVGVNNRNLHDFSVSLDTSGELAQRIPTDYVKVTESGLSSATDIEALRAVGYRGFLIGETFMRHSRPEKACAALVQQLRTTEAITLL